MESTIAWRAMHAARAMWTGYAFRWLHGRPSPEMQHEMVGSTPLSDQTDIAVLLLGFKETLKSLTRRFSLQKGS